MKKILCMSVALLGVTAVSAQSVTDVLKYSKNDIVGTARYMGMAGAFGALGGDITTLSQNPAGIGVYRSSEVVTTFSLGGVDTKSEIGNRNSGVDSPILKNSKFNIGCNNLGYVGTFLTGKRSGLINFNVGFSFNRLGGEKRTYRITQNGMQSSLSDYIADRTNIWASGNQNVQPGDLGLNNTASYDPYYDSSAPWLSILGYNAFVINNVTDGNGNSYYEGLYPGNYSVGGDLKVEEKNRIDEYTFNFGGNFDNMLYWGVGIGVTDLTYKLRTFYDEYYWSAGQPDSYKDFGNYRLDNYLDVSGTGINIKAGMIFRPTNSLRLGVAVHTPTWYAMSENYGANMESYNVPDIDNNTTVSKNVNTPNDTWEYNMRTPWKFQVSAAYILQQLGLISFEYEMVDYSSMHLSERDGFRSSYDYTNEDIQNQLRSVNTFKVGAEFRITPVTSVRVGYANQSSPYVKAVKENISEIYPGGTIPNYTIDRGTQYYTAGLGFRSGSWFTDMAFVWKENQQDAYLLPKVADGGIYNTKSKLTTSSYRFLLTLGYKF